MTLRKPSAWDERECIREALVSLRHARNNFRAIGATKAANACARALKSAEGAQRHSERVLREAERREAARAALGVPASWVRS